jgi:hypothetical protein
MGTNGRQEVEVACGLSHKMRATVQDDASLFQTPWPSRLLLDWLHYSDSSYLQKSLSCQRCICRNL